MAEEITDYFCSLFTSHVGDRMEDLLDRIPTRVTPAMNKFLMKKFTSDKVRSALDSIADLKAPGCDDMSDVFFNAIGTVGEQVTDEVLHVLNGGDILQAWNETCVVVTPR